MIVSHRMREVVPLKGYTHTHGHQTYDGYNLVLQAPSRCTHDAHVGHVPGQSCHKDCLCHQPAARGPALQARSALTCPCRALPAAWVPALRCLQAAQGRCWRWRPHCCVIQGWQRGVAAGARGTPCAGVWPLASGKRAARLPALLKTPRMRVRNIIRISQT